MKIDIITIFPDIFTPLDCSIIKRAKKSGKVEINIHNLRDYTEDSHRTVDDAPYGGGSGMVMKVVPLYKAVSEIKQLNHGAKVVFMSPQGKVLTQEKCRELSALEGLVIVCAHYEGVDERFVRLVCDEEISIGDYILTGGELPAMILADAVTRLLPGVIDEESAREESFTDGLLDYPHYTRPAEFLGLKVPEILLSGNHSEIGRWRSEQKVFNTFAKRPELLADVALELAGQKSSKKSRRKKMA